MIEMNYTSDEINDIENDFKSLILENEKEKVVSKNTEVEIIDDANNNKISEDEVEVISTPTNVEIIPD